MVFEASTGVVVPLVVVPSLVVVPLAFGCGLAFGHGWGGCAFGLGIVVALDSRDCWDCRGGGLICGVSIVVGVGCGQLFSRTNLWARSCVKAQRNPSKAFLTSRQRCDSPRFATKRSMPSDTATLKPSVLPEARMMMARMKTATEPDLWIPRRQLIKT